MWALFEPIHAVVYFTPDSRTSFEAAGLRGFWRGYFASRAAPFGPVGPGTVYATFFGFARPMVDRALPDVWSRATPEAALDARREGARVSLSRLLSDVDTSGVAEAARLLREAVGAADFTGRPLAAANADLPWPDDELDTLWQAATVLREHRGDGHVAALVAAGVDGCEAQVWRAAIHGGRDWLQPARGWTDEDWDAAAGRLAQRGWLNGTGATEAGVAAHEELEATTDRVAEHPWQRLGADSTQRLAELLRPLATAVARDLPYPSPIGVPRPA
jgi:hypothetical protein